MYLYYMNRTMILIMLMFISFLGFIQYEAFFPTTGEKFLLFMPTLFTTVFMLFGLKE